MSTNDAQRRLEDAVLVDGEHRYLSTGCLHGRHEHCNCLVRIDGGPKTPGRCKFCPAKCVCECHL